MALPKTCAAPLTCTPGLAGTFNYQIFQWTNPVAQCVTVTYSATTASFGFVTVHNAPPTLTNLCTNWVADPGSSATVGTPIVFSFNGTAGTTYYFLVTNVGTPPTGCTLDISAPNCAAAGPSVTINQAAAQPDPTSVEPINFTAVFSEAVTGFATGDVTLSGTAGATLATVTGGPTTYNVAVTGMTGSGTVIASIAAGVCTSVATTSPNVASTSSDNTVTYNLVLGCTSVDPIASDTVCNGATHPGKAFTSPTAGTTFSWVNNTPAIGLAASGTGNIAPFTATNPGTTPLVATVTVTPSLTFVFNLL
ncbi:MAG: hypothetical protein IPL84_13185 [Chitinophagaceae bacterium]|nr:hypothetical protein [Chitinophagaceae bacterium]